jgi:ribosome-binding protein aMBF1 (putative translation factor)
VVVGIKEEHVSVSFRSKKVLLAVGAAALTAALLGGAALAAFAPVVDYDPVSAVEAQLGIAAPANSGTDKFKAILDALAAKGVITPAQVDAILAAVRDAGPKRGDGELKRILASLLDGSTKYLGLTIGELKTKLPGTSLGAIANTTPGKSRAGLVADLQNAVNAAIDKALAANTITKAQSDKAKADAPGQIAKFVDHVYEQRPAPKTTTRVPKVTEFVGEAITVARDYLGTSQTDLTKAMREGKSLGDIANATAGKSRDGLVAQLTTVANAKIDKAVTDGKLTAEAATALKGQVGSAVTALVDRKGPTAIFKR